MENGFDLFFNVLDKYLPYLSLILVIIGIVIFIGYWIRLIMTKGFKNKYDFIGKNEIKALWYSVLMILIAAAIYPYQFVSEYMLLRHFVDLFIAISLALILGSVFYYTIKFYYPHKMNRRLKSLRYKPRISPKSGKSMKLLTEGEEDVYLDEGMQAEEDVFSIDYDVWIDEETGYTQIEKYLGKLSVSECPSCGYQTLKVEKEELIIAPTPYASGELMKRYKCSYCGHREKEIFTVAKLREER